ncbi:MAG: hypothetical protein FWD12_08525, partial [Alphaproteobacteria bacterium]|nr:hypothetical protein [Alphaproteobacteria bacterium]
SWPRRHAYGTLSSPHCKTMPNECRSNDPRPLPWPSGRESMPWYATMIGFGLGIILGLVVVFVVVILVASFSA